MRIGCHRGVYTRVRARAGAVGTAASAERGPADLLQQLRVYQPLVSTVHVVALVHCYAGLSQLSDAGGGGMLPMATYLLLHLLYNVSPLVSPVRVQTRWSDLAPTLRLSSAAAA